MVDQSLNPISLDVAVLAYCKATGLNPAQHEVTMREPITQAIEAYLRCGEIRDTDLSKCPKCGGPADNGHDRCLPPSPYYCTKCTAAEQPDEMTDELWECKVANGEIAMLYVKALEEIESLKARLSEREAMQPVGITDDIIAKLLDDTYNAEELWEEWDGDSPTHGDYAEKAFKACSKALRPYLRQPERESVNLAIAANAMFKSDEAAPEGINITEDYRRLAKACADAWDLTVDDKPRRGSDV